MGDVIRKEIIKYQAAGFLLLSAAFYSLCHHLQTSYMMTNVKYGLTLKLLLTAFSKEDFDLIL